jgi:ABC-type sulfate transport system substrate-binding protein
MWYTTDWSVIQIEIFLYTHRNKPLIHQEYFSTKMKPIAQKYSINSPKCQLSSLRKHVGSWKVNSQEKVLHSQFICQYKYININIYYMASIFLMNHTI